MSIAEMEEQVRGLSREDRLQLMSVLNDLDEREDEEEYRRRMAAKIDNKDPANWVSLEEFSRQLRELEAQEGQV